MKIYLDFAATTPVDPAVLKEMRPYFGNDFGNPSSFHYFGQKASRAMEEARKNVADFLGCLPAEIIFAASATEANNLAIRGLTMALKKKVKTPHIITSSIEHQAVLAPCRALEKEGIEVTYLSVAKEGFVKLSDLKKAIKPNTVLVSIMYANNEIGTVQPISEIGSLLKTINYQSKNKIYFHTDAVQAANYLDCDVRKLGVDLLTLSAHKIYGPKGVGALYIKANTPIEPVIFGSEQEGGLRPGTENIPAIVGLGAAIEKIKNPTSAKASAGKQKSKIKIIKRLKEKLFKGIIRNIPDVQLNGSPDNSLPNILNMTFLGAEGEAIGVALDVAGIAVSTGSACAAKDLKSSHVILALGFSEEEAHGAVRFSLGKYTTEKEINDVLKILPRIVEKLRKISGYKIKRDI